MNTINLPQETVIEIGEIRKTFLGFEAVIVVKNKIITDDGGRVTIDSKEYLVDKGFTLTVTGIKAKVEIVSITKEAQ